MKSPMKSIRLKCLDCCGASAQYVRCCPSTDCPLWPYRFGKRPGTAIEINPLLVDRAFFDKHVNVELSVMDRLLTDKNPRADHDIE